MRTWQLCAAWLGALVVSPRVSLAQGGPTEQLATAPSKSAIVFVRADASVSEASGVLGMEAQLSELARVVSAEPMGGLTLASQAFRAAELAREHQALGTIWFSQGHGQRLRVHVYDAKHRQLASRTLARPDAAAHEEVAVVLRSAIAALIAGMATELEPVTLEPARPPPPHAAPAPHPAKDPPVHFLAGAAYAGTTYASGSFQHGLELLLAAELTPRVLLGINGTWSSRATLSGGGAEALLQRYPLELFAGYAFARNLRFRSFGEAGLVVEQVSRSTRISDPRLSALPDEKRLRVALAPRLRALFEPEYGLLFFAAFGADITTDRYDYVVQSTSGPVRLAPRTVRPRLEVGVFLRF